MDGRRAEKMEKHFSVFLRSRPAAILRIATGLDPVAAS
jgi:hypothetical protein